MSTERTSALPLSGMDKASRARLEALLDKEPSGLTDGDRAFLHARRAYLTADQRKDFDVSDKAPAAPAANGDKYDAMDKDALKAEAKKRKLPVSGKVGELRARLREADAQA